MKNVMRILAGMALVALMFQAAVLVASKEKIGLFTFMDENISKKLDDTYLANFKGLIVKAKESIDKMSGTNDHTPLTWAIRKNLPDMVEFILLTGANPDIAGMFFETPLLFAAKEYVRTGEDGYAVIFEKLLKYNANPKIDFLSMSAWGDPVKTERIKKLGSTLQAARETDDSLDEDEY